MRKKRFLKAICLDCGDTLIDEGTEVKNEHDVSLKADLIPGADTLMHALKKEGYPLALVADGPVATFHNNLGPFDLFRLFDAVSISEAVGVSKPDPAIFQHAMDQLQIKQADFGRVLMLGNHLGRDIKGANRLGMISVWLDWAPRRHKVPRDKSEEPQFKINTPLQLLKVIAQLEQQPGG